MQLIAKTHQLTPPQRLTESTSPPSVAERQKRHLALFPETVGMRQSQRQDNSHGLDLVLGRLVLPLQIAHCNW